MSRALVMRKREEKMVYWANKVTVIIINTPTQHESDPQMN